MVDDRSLSMNGVSVDAAMGKKFSIGAIIFKDG